jgi:hypothetical protein
MSESFVTKSTPAAREINMKIQFKESWTGC